MACVSPALGLCGEGCCIYPLVACSFLRLSLFFWLDCVDRQLVPHSDFVPGFRSAVSSVVSVRSGFPVVDSSFPVLWLVFRLLPSGLPCGFPVPGAGWLLSRSSASGLWFHLPVYHGVFRLPFLFSRSSLALLVREYQALFCGFAKFDLPVYHFLVSRFLGFHGCGLAGGPCLSPDFNFGLSLPSLSVLSFEFTDFYVFPGLGSRTVSEFGRGRRSRRPLLSRHLSLLAPRPRPMYGSSLGDVLQDRTLWFFPQSFFVDGGLGLCGLSSNADLVATEVSRRGVCCRFDRVELS